MVATANALYKAHVQNLRAIDVAFKAVIRELNSSLVRSDNNTASALLKTSMLLLGGWAENRLRKLSYEPNGFSLVEREQIAAAETQLDSWKTALELGFRKRHAIPNANLRTALPLTPRSQFLALDDIINTELRPIIEIRNKLAHGQWARALNSENTDFSAVHNQQINCENAHSVKCKHRIMESLAQLIHDLVAGNGAFTRDFDKHFKNLETAKRDISRRSYESWLSHMRVKHQEGKAKRLASFQAMISSK